MSKDQVWKITSFLHKRKKISGHRRSPGEQIRGEVKGGTYLKTRSCWSLFAVVGVERRTLRLQTVQNCDRGVTARVMFRRRSHNDLCLSLRSEAEHEVRLNFAVTGVNFTVTCVPRWLSPFQILHLVQGCPAFSLLLAAWRLLCEFRSETEFIRLYPICL